MQQVIIKTPNRKIKTTEYANLAGVDFSQEAALVDGRRSPDSVNMISDNGKTPVKRPGWKTELSNLGYVHNIWKPNIYDRERLIIHAGNKLCGMELMDGEVGHFALHTIKDNVPDSKSSGFFFGNGDSQHFYILTGKEYLRGDEFYMEDVSEFCYIPTTTIARKPSGGGESYEDINLISGTICEKYTGDENSVIYQLVYPDFVTVEKIEVVEGGTVKTLEKNVDYTFDAKMGTVTFTKAHPTQVTGEDNVYITYTKEFEGYKDKICKCTCSCVYGVGGNNRVFLSGNPDYKAYDFWSDIYRADYWPDTNFAIIGTTETAVMGYVKTGKNVAIVKESSDNDTSIYIRSGSLDSEGNAVFTVEAGITGLGAVSKHSFAVLNDDPLFLSSRGVYAISPASLTNDRVTRNRSWYVDARLREEPNLQNAVACVWNGCYLLCINGNVYVLDGRKKTTGGNSNDNDYKYECYFWNNVPATCITATKDGELWFGTADGRVCRFKTEEADGMYCYSDDDAPIRALWSTPFDDDGCIQYFKTLQKKGSLAVLKPYQQSSCDVYFGTDDGRKILSESMSFSTLFEFVNFIYFSFNPNRNPREVYFNKKQRKYKRLQIFLENNKANEGFGVYKIVKTYTIEGYSKNRR